MNLLRVVHKTNHSLFRKKVYLFNEKNTLFRCHFEFAQITNYAQTQREKRKGREIL